jgi:LysR family cyn operon transcriptional activator
MDLSQLRAFVAIVDCGGIGRAAVRLNASQPALSRQLQSLEASLGVRLFDRERRRMLLTAAGEGLLGRARSILLEADALKEAARGFETGDSGLIRLGATPPMIEAPLAPFLGRWRREHPRIAVHLVENGGSTLADMLDAGQVHLAYVPADDDRFECRLLYPVHVVAAVAAADGLARTPMLELADIAGRPLLALRPGFGSRDWFDVACRSAGLRPTIALESASHSAVLALAASGYGIGILPSAVVPPRNVRLIPLVHHGAAVGRWTMLAWSRGRFLASYARAFVNAFATYAQSRYPGRGLVERAPPIAPPRDRTRSANAEAAAGRRHGRGASPHHPERGSVERRTRGHGRPLR